MFLRNPNTRFRTNTTCVSQQRRFRTSLSLLDPAPSRYCSISPVTGCGRLDKQTRSLVTRATKTKGQKAKSSSTNRLIDEQSPELLRYAHSKIAWYPWGQEAFDKAASEQKVILLSIGFSSSHWCHLMEQESFEDAETAQFVNENFIPVKVDREERPDLDRWCTTFVYLTLGKTGWPITMFMTPDRAPIFGACYLPNVEKYNLPDFKSVMADVLREWNADKERMIVEANESWKRMTNEFIKEPLPYEPGFSNDETLVDLIMNSCANHLIQQYDEEFGGFGETEKFPQISYLNLIMRQFQKKVETTERDAVAYLMKMVVCTLGAMYDGGIRDHVGGGFHRYTIDRNWHVPEFEKGLLDNAQIARVYLSAVQLFTDEHWVEVARSTLDCLQRDFLSPEGGFHSSIDSDSVDKESDMMREGAYYTWDAEEIKSVLTEKEYTVFSKYYSILKDGNCNLAKSKDEEPIFTNVLVINDKWEDVAKEVGLKKKSFFKTISNCRRKLFEARNKTKELPKKNEKIICGWNGMVIGAFALASRILANQEQPLIPEAFPVADTPSETYLVVAKEAAAFVLQNLWKEDEEKQHLMRYYVNGNSSSIEAYAEDYAYLICGLLDLYSCCGEHQWLEWAIKLQEKMDSLFWDEEHGGYFSATLESTSLPARTKMYYDSEEPTASSIALSNLLRFGGVISESERSREKARTIIQSFADFAQNESSSLPELAASSCLMDLHPSLLKLIIIGDPDHEKSQTFINAMHSAYTPAKSLICINPEIKESVDFWKKISPDVVERHEKYWNPQKAKESGLEGEFEFEFPLFFLCHEYEFTGPYDDPSMLLKYIKTDP